MLHHEQLGWLDKGSDSGPCVGLSHAVRSVPGLDRNTSEASLERLQLPSQGLKIFPASLSHDICTGPETAGQAG